MDKKILEETKKILESEKNMRETVISVYDLSKLFKGTHTNIQTLEYNLSKKLFSLGDIKKIPGIDRFNCGYYVRFLPEYKLLEVGMISYDHHAYYRKEEGDLKLITSKGNRIGEVTPIGWETFGKKVLAGAGDILSDYYDEFIKHIDYYFKSSKKIKPINSCFLVETDANGVNIIMKEDNDIFKLSEYVDQDNYYYHCKSNNTISILRGNEEEVLKRIFVKIKDCPEWSQETLRELRQKQLKKEKKLQFVKKIIPFIKK